MFQIENESLSYRPCRNRFAQRVRSSSFIGYNTVGYGGRTTSLPPLPDHGLFRQIKEQEELELGGISIRQMGGVGSYMGSAGGSAGGSSRDSSGNYGSAR